MAVPFAAIESATASSAMAALANVEITLGGSTVLAVFDDAYSAPLGMAGSAPSLLLASSDAASVVAGTTTVTINDASYTVTEVQPDGTGLTRLMLQEAA